MSRRALLFTPMLLNVTQCTFLLAFLHSALALCKFEEPLWYNVSLKDSNGT